jgi:hypothetical protein
MEEVYNRKIRLEPFTYEEALKICYQCVDEKRKELDKVDVHNQGLSLDYQLTLLALQDLYFVKPEDITNENNRS